MQSGILTPGTLFYRVFHDSPVGMVITTVNDGRYVEVNAVFARLLDFAPDSPPDGTLAPIGLENEDERNLVIDVLRTVGKLGNVPLTLRTSGDETRACIASVQLEEIGGGEYLLFIVQDITDQERAQAALRSSEQRFRLFFQSVPLPLLVIDDATRRVLDVNTAACQVYGYRHNEFINLSWDDLWAGGALLSEMRPGGNGRGPSQTVMACHRLKDGALIDVDVLAYSFLLDQRPVTLTIVENVTEQRVIQEALRASEERLRIIADLATDAIWERDMATDEVVWSSGLASLFGYSEDAERPHDWWVNHIHPEDRPEIDATLDAAFTSGATYWVGEYRFLRADGHYANVLDRGYIIRDADGRAARFIGAMVDITEQFHLAEASAQAALEERQRLARDLHDSVTQSLYSISLMAEAARRHATAGDQTNLTDFIDRLGELSQQALRQLRLLVYELRPGVLAQEGLAGALRHRLEAVERRAGLQASLIDESTARIPLPIKAEIFRVAQEALNHSLKFASAHAVTVYLRTTEDDVVLQISDDGLPFDQRPELAQISLADLQRHLSNVGGQLSLATAPTGAIMRLSFPMGDAGELDE